MATLSMAFSSLSMSCQKKTNLSSRTTFSVSVSRPQQCKIDTTIQAGKLKTCKAASKRFRVTGTGKVIRRRPMKQHMLEKKSASRCHRLEGFVSIDNGDYNNIIGQMPHAGIKKPGNQKKCTK
mmetsp:Transcript_12483/g.17007  ORF Transcript_12483/g.17007 Transcript_12483/m.17007 type:complete len:123 (+) Transcript_12483:87-455(+)|eukprot:CAMPEP_0196579868 /NCGR_PEP_ID=MMETSP1081-20130531/25331_1 /TAXON_ID=36882 /ORGANISM="Pyramimonas amylifera, Strain CCMP720" /LENGTH=122 /DNA_ID=CAMNT_0041899575 /DNA_START=76 /DNA_END=444 /DNA_ORIENTATION=+